MTIQSTDSSWHGCGTQRTDGCDIRSPPSMDATRMLRFPRASVSFAAKSRLESQRYNPRMSASMAAALATHGMVICGLGLLLSACGSSLAGLLGGQAPSSSPTVDSQHLTLTAA